MLANHRRKIAATSHGESALTQQDQDLLGSFMKSRMSDPEKPEREPKLYQILLDFCEGLVTRPDSQTLAGLSFPNLFQQEIRDAAIAAKYARVVLQIRRDYEGQFQSLRDIAGASLKIEHTYNLGGRNPESAAEAGVVTIHVKECRTLGVVLLTFAEIVDATEHNTSFFFYDGINVEDLPSYDEHGNETSGDRGPLEIRDPIDRFPVALARLIKENDRQTNSKNRIVGLLTSSRERRAAKKKEDREQREDYWARRWIASRLMQAALDEAGSTAITQLDNRTEETRIGQNALVVYNLLTGSISPDLNDPSTTAAALTLTMYGYFFEQGLYQNFLQYRWFGVWATDEARSLHKKASLPSVGSEETDYEEDAVYEGFFRDLLNGRWAPLISPEIKCAFGYARDATIGDKDVVAVGLRIYMDLIINSLPEHDRNTVRSDMSDYSDEYGEGRSLVTRALTSLKFAVINLGMRRFHAAQQNFLRQTLPPADRITLREFLLAIKATEDLPVRNFEKMAAHGDDQYKFIPGSKSFSGPVRRYLDGGGRPSEDEIDRLLCNLQQCAPSIPAEFFSGIRARL